MGLKTEMKFSEDVEQILREHGRDCDFEPSSDGLCRLCGESQDCHDKPSVQQIIEEAVRLWAAKQERDRQDAVAREIAKQRPTASVSL